jgi:hypothetical protein
VDGVQVTLFPDPHTIVLVRMDEETGANLPDLLHKVRPRLVADLRSMPRFDFGYLNRSRIFHTFAELAIAYHDLGGAPEQPDTTLNEPATNAIHAILRRAAEGPMVLLLEPDADTDRAFSLLGCDHASQRNGWNILVQ